MSAVEKFSALGGGVKNLAIGLAVLGAVAGVVYVLVKVLPAAKKVVTEKLNPVSDKNIFYETAGALVGADNETATLGTTLYDLFHPGTRDFYDPAQAEKTRAALRR